ncbi:hypothetical protein SH601_01850 [Gracilibacillus sp. S3-1-1]|uniref:Uncharacterized protein n=2 Tax=Gracilibacillus pellucidus TaxID=3095368 RepID=A0ACC6M1H1_9BACI|nr:hypothetical protein [Gracilibacillus sp. S3-1-1]MDX8044717.1 hypothetical protein [Gracilibacillus sp. S3-1-1]
MQQQNTTPIMDQPPKMISTKDHLYLTDMLSWNLNASKKARFFAENCSIPEVKQAINKACEMHEKHYNIILNHLKDNKKTFM